MRSWSAKLCEQWVRGATRLTMLAAMRKAESCSSSHPMWSRYLFLSHTAINACLSPCSLLCRSRAGLQELGKALRIEALSGMIANANERKGLDVLGFDLVHDSVLRRLIRKVIVHELERNVAVLKEFLGLLA